MANSLSVIIPCKNERRNIRPCIESAQLVADEVLIADSGSTDGTLDIVREIGGCRIIEREYIHSGDFKNWAIPQAKHSWVMILDADERITADLAKEIREMMSRGPNLDGYWVYRNNYLFGHRVRYGGWGYDTVLRLFHRDIGRYVGDTDHAEVEVTSGRVGTLRGRLEHYTTWSYDQCLRKTERYTDWQARVWHAQGRKPSLVRLVLNGPLRFLRSYIFHLGFLDGSIGFQIGMLNGIYSYLKQARLWQLHYGLSQPDPEAHRNSHPEAKANQTSRAA
jgi:glycosyltransferase involved in cell wall biosynthesis